MHRSHHRGRRAQELESTVVVKTEPNEKKKVISDLRPFSNYTLKVTVYNIKGEGPFSEALPFETPEGGENTWVKEARNKAGKGRSDDKVVKDVLLQMIQIRGQETWQRERENYMHEEKRNETGSKG